MATPTPPAPPAARRSPIRRVLRVIKWVVLVFVALVAVGIGAVTIIVNTDWGRRQIKGIIVDNLEKSFPCGVKVGALEGNVLGDATVRDVVLTDCDRREAIKVAKIELNLELTALVEGALRLVEGSDGQDGLPAIRAGVAYGPAVNRWGDWYGSTVNVASRLTGRARPSSVLATEAVRDATGGGFEWSFAGEKRLKGLSAAVKTYRARRA